MIPFIHKIYIYPIKSLEGISMQSVEIDSQGLKGDREYLLVDQNNLVITQRKFPQLTRFSLSFIQDKILIEDKISGKKILLESSFSPDNSFEILVWDDLVLVEEVNEALSFWFSEILEFSVKLVKICSTAIRPIQKAYQGDFSKTIRFVDGMPISIISTASLRNLAVKYGDFNWQRFRANILIENTIPHQEDHWKEIHLKNVNLESKKLCKRCNLISVDPDSGELDPGFLQVLGKYRRQGHHIVFGNQFIPKNAGKITVLDEISFE